GTWTRCWDIRRILGDSMYVLPKQQRIAELARRSPQMGFTSLAYLMDIDWLEAAFHRTRKDGAPGVDGQTWFDYERNLEANLQLLLERAKSGTYRAPPVRRVYIPKAGSTTETRPGGPGRLPAQGSHRSVRGHIRPYGSSSNPFASQQHDNAAANPSLAIRWRFGNT